MLFSNTPQSVLSPLRHTLLKLVTSGVTTVSAEKALRNTVRRVGERLKVGQRSFSLQNRRVFVIGFGKAVLPMAAELERIIGARRIAAGAVIAPRRTRPRLKKISVYIGDHPLPSARGMAGVKKIMDLKQAYQFSKRDLIIALISGGGSALAPLPVPGITLADKRQLTKILLRSGASGYENTTVKSKISAIKGGKLATYFFPTPIISLIISDDNGAARHEMTASGPFTPDRTTVSQAIKIIKQHKISKYMPRAIMKYLYSHRLVKNKPTTFPHVFERVIATNELLVKEIARLGRRRGWRVFAAARQCGPAQALAKRFCARLRNFNGKRPAFFVYGGETTVRLGARHGRGGRNQECVAACLAELIKKPPRGPWCITAIATDGADSISHIAGAIIDHTTINAVKKTEVRVSEYLDHHNTYPLLKKIGALVWSRHFTSTNVGDILIGLFRPAQGH